MKLYQIREKVFKNGWPTPLGWICLSVFVVVYMFLKHAATERRRAQSGETDSSTVHTFIGSNGVAVTSTVYRQQSDHLAPPESPLPPPEAPVLPSGVSQAPVPNRQYNEPSFGNLETSNHILSENFLPKGTIIYATLTSDIVSNNQLSPVTATIIHPVVLAHKIMIPIGAQIVGKIAPGNLRGRVFVNWDTIIFYDEGRQGWELPIKGFGMTYEQHPVTGRWIINGAGLKGYVYDDSTSTAFKLASIKAAEDFAKTLQTFVTTQNSAVTSGSVVTTTTTTPEATLKNSGLGAAAGFLDVIAQRYQAQLTQPSIYVLVPTARMSAIFLDEAIDIETASPGRSIQSQNK